MKNLVQKVIYKVMIPSINTITSNCFNQEMKFLNIAIFLTDSIHHSTYICIVKCAWYFPQKVNINILIKL